MSKVSLPYPKPGPIGGRLIRETISFMRKQGMELPMTSHILIATSGGCDSVALAHLLTHFGRRIGDRSQIALLHINHRWRGTESDLDEEFVNGLGKRWGVKVVTRRLKPPRSGTGQSLEDEARKARKKIYAELANQCSGVVLTAHQADDLAETVLWRLLTGAAETHGGGVAFRHGSEIRPFLTVRKSVIKKYLEEVGETYREDMTNFSNRFLRAKMRSILMPEAERLFPKAIAHLGELALKAQAHDLQVTCSENSSLEGFSSTEVPGFLIQAAGLKTRRAHLTTIFEKLVAKPPWYGEIHLPGGWRLIREKMKKTRKSVSEDSRIKKNQSTSRERWILEKI